MPTKITDSSLNCTLNTCSIEGRIHAFMIFWLSIGIYLIGAQSWCSHHSLASHSYLLNINLKISIKQFIEVSFKNQTKLLVVDVKCHISRR